MRVLWVFVSRAGCYFVACVDRHCLFCDPPLAAGTQTNGQHPESHEWVQSFELVEAQRLRREYRAVVLASGVRWEELRQDGWILEQRDSKHWSTKKERSNWIRDELKIQALRMLEQNLT